MSNPHEKLAMQFFSPPGPSAREWSVYSEKHGYSDWQDGARLWPDWAPFSDYKIRLKPQTITLPERSIPKPLDVGELVKGEAYWLADPTDDNWALKMRFIGTYLSFKRAERGLYYPFTDQGRADAIAAAKGMIGRDEG